MKKKTVLFIFPLFLGAAMLLYTGCKKEEKTEPTTPAATGPSNYSAASDNAAADNAFAGIWRQVSTVTDSSNTLRAPAGCATATITPFDLTTWPKTVTIDFGTVNCVCSDGVSRRGVITAVFSGPFLDSASTINITLTDYYHNDYHITGTQTVTNSGRNGSGNLVYQVTVSGATVTNPPGTETSTWNTTQDREWFAGESTSFNILDDVWKITGNSSGVSVDGDNYTVVINTALQINVGCPWIVKGSWTLTYTSWPAFPVMVDYGTGTCDNSATVTFNGNTYTFVLY